MQLDATCHLLLTVEREQPQLQSLSYLLLHGKILHYLEKLVQM